MLITCKANVWIGKLWCYKWLKMLFPVNESSESNFCFLAGGFVPIVTLFLLVSVLACRFGFSAFSD